MLTFQPETITDALQKALLVAEILQPDSECTTAENNTTTCETTNNRITSSNIACDTPYPLLLNNEAFQNAAQLNNNF